METAETNSEQVFRLDNYTYLQLVRQYTYCMSVFASMCPVPVVSLFKTFATNVFDNITANHDAAIKSTRIKIEIKMLILSWSKTTSSPMGNGRSPGSQHNVWRYIDL